MVEHMNSIVTVVIVLILWAALLTTVYTNTYGGTLATGAYENFSATAKQVICLVFLVYCFLGIGIIAAALYKMFSGGRR